MYRFLLDLIRQRRLEHPTGTPASKTYLSNPVQLTLAADQVAVLSAAPHQRLGIQRTGQPACEHRPRSRWRHRERLLSQNLPSTKVVQSLLRDSLPPNHTKGLPVP